MATPRSTLAPQQQCGRIAVQMFGPLRVRCGSTVLDGQRLGGSKPRQILEILSLSLGNPVSKDALIELLWGGHPPAGAVKTLESYICVLRRNLQPGRPRTGPLQTTTAGYLLDRPQVDLDLDAFTSLLGAAGRASAPEDAYRALCRALELAAEPLLADEFVAEWAEGERRFHQSRLAATRIRAAEAAIALCRPDDAATWAEAALAGDPLSERAWTALVLALEQSHRHAEALHAYERCRQTLKHELGCGPGPALLAAYARLLHATAGSGVELSNVLSALLAVHEHLGAQSTRRAGSAPRIPTARIHESVQDAAKAMDAFLRWALAAM